MIFGRSQLLAVAVALLASLTAPAAAADECRPQHRADLSVRLVQGLPLVVVTAGRSDATLILDTGAERSILTSAAAEHLGLHPHSEYPRTMRGLTGAVASGAVELHLGAGGASLPNFGVLVGPISLPTLGGTTPDGLLGADILSSFEVDIDLPHGVLRLYDRASCPIAGPPWRETYTALPVNRSLHDRLFFRVMLDEHRLAAIFDTGSQNTVIDERSAVTLGVDAQVLGQEPAKTIRGVTGAESASHIHRFGRLAIGDETFINPVLIVARLNLDDADLVIGMNYLRARRVWLSYGAHKVFIAHPSQRNG
jgi:predicted aspartyl protease